MHIPPCSSRPGLHHKLLLRTSFAGDVVAAELFDTEVLTFNAGPVAGAGLAGLLLGRLDDPPPKNEERGTEDAEVEVLEDVLLDRFTELPLPALAGDRIFCASRTRSCEKSTRGISASKSGHSNTKLCNVPESWHSTLR